KGLNDHEIGPLITFALQQPCVRGITFQPIQSAGRLEHFNTETHRLPLTEVRSQILAQSNLFAPEDIIPVPCHPDCLAMAYALKLPAEDVAADVAAECNADSAHPNVIPLTRLIDPHLLLSGEGNTIIYEQNA